MSPDPLHPYPEQFIRPEDGVYLLGHSLGLAPKSALATVRRATEQEWARGLAASWNDAGWFEAPGRMGAKLARLIGAAADEVVIADSTSVNLFKLAVAALEINPRPVLLMEQNNFPTDLYVLQRAAELMGRTVRTAPREELINALNTDVALVCASEVDYRTGHRLDGAELTRAAREAGVVCLLDIAHAVGAVALDAGDYDLAVGCCYKYLSGGPGAPAFAFVSRVLQGQLRNPIAGWLGHAAPFAFAPDYQPAAGAVRWAAGTPPILAMAALEAALDLHLETDMNARAARAFALGETFLTALGDTALQRITPARRGAHLAFRHSEGLAIRDELKAAGVICDFRAPDVLRFGFAPLTLTFDEAARAGDITAAVMRRGVWREAQRTGVVT
jgi:kynureninase